MTDAVTQDTASASTKGRTTYQRMLFLIQTTILIELFAYFVLMAIYLIAKVSVVFIVLTSLFFCAVLRCTDVAYVAVAVA